MTTLTIILPALIVAAVIIYAATLVHAWRHWDGAEPVCSLDCRDWQRRGILDPDCPVHHQTNHFALTESEKTND